MSARHPKQHHEAESSAISQNKVDYIETASIDENTSINQMCRTSSSSSLSTSSLSLLATFSLATYLAYLFRRNQTTVAFLVLQQYAFDIRELSEAHAQGEVMRNA
jgi:hypothetical protein